jgi:hypothetical protein
MLTPNLGLPQVMTERTSQHRWVVVDGILSYVPGGAIIDGAKSRDYGNTDNTRGLRAGTLMGRVTSGGKWANSVLGETSGALTNSGTTITVSAASAVEIVRRIGATGTLSVTGPPTAAGTVRTLTATYSAVNTTTGAITITALGVNGVQTVNLSTAATGGSIRLLVPKTDGTTALTPAAAWSATDATLLSNLNTALDTATGVVGGIVATAIAATDTDLGFVLTFSGTGYAGNTWPLVEVHTLFTSNTGANVVRTTTGVDGRMVTAALVGPTDGSQIPLSFIPNGNGLYIASDGTATGSLDQPYSGLPWHCRIDGRQLLPWPADTSLQEWVRSSLNSKRQEISFIEQLTA